MTRRVTWIMVTGVALVILCWSWLLINFDPVTVKTHEGAGIEAFRNPHLAFERFMARMGRPLKATSDVREIGTLPRGGVLIIGTDVDRRAVITAERAVAIKDWVARGGHLILATAGSDNNDPLMRQFAMRWKRWRPPPAKGEIVNPDGDPEAGQVLRDSVRRAHDGEDDIYAQIPGDPRRLRMSPSDDMGSITEFGTSPVWFAQSRLGTQIVHLPIALGSVTVLTDLDKIISNDAISDNDNAEAIWSIVNQGGGRGPVLILKELHVGSLWRWIYRSAPYVAAALLVTLLLWLWMVVPRFGPLLAEPAEARLGLSDHLAAMGRAVWRLDRERGLTYWLDATRTTVIGRYLRREPLLSDANTGEQAERISKLSGESQGQVRMLLTRQNLDRGSASRVAFTKAIQMLQKLDRKP